MTAPRWAQTLLRLLATEEHVDEVLGDLEEAHRIRIQRRGRALASVLTVFDTLDVAAALVRQRLGKRSSMSLLEFRLGVRMLVKYPGLTMVGGLAMAFAIWVSALTFEVVQRIVAPDLPLDEGDRIVGIRNIDVEAGRLSVPVLDDFATWHGELRTIEELSAFRTLTRNLIVDGAPGEPIEVAEMSATSFSVTRVPPLFGRPLVETDEEIGAPDVLVIGYDLWQSRFDGDPEVIGKAVGVGGTNTTVVGVMPQGFSFPIAHKAWLPLRRSPVELQPGEGVQVAVFGRLAPGATMAEAQAELEVLAARRAADFPAILGQIRPRVMRYARSVRPLPDVGPAGLLAANVFVLMLLLLICGNVALLVFARAATREREIAVRSALGASRARLVYQLFAEALVLGGLAAAVGLVGAGFGVKWYVAMLRADTGGMVPFWIRDALAPTTAIYLLGLTVIGAAVIGVVPGLKVTGRRVELRLRRSASGVGNLSLSGVWTPVIVAQVALTLAFPATAFFFHRYVQQIQSLDLGFAAEEYLSLRLERDSASGPRAVAELSVHQELKERLLSEPGVRGVTVANHLPGDPHPGVLIEIEVGDVRSDGLSVHRAAVAEIGEDFFRVLETPVSVGRSFDSSDSAVDASLLVNRAFEEALLEGRSAIGRRVRYAARAGQDPGPWLEIRGVVENLGIVGDVELRAEPGIYRRLPLREAYPVQMAVHVPGDPEAFVPRLRAIAAEVDPALRLQDIRRLDRVSESRWRESEFLYQLLSGVSAVALILSLTTIYSVMSFTVSRRTREIGVRVALGSSQSRVILSIFHGPLIRVAVGMLMGTVLVLLVTRGLAGPLTSREILWVAFYAVAMLGVCLLACIVPTRRALGIEPTEALNAEA